MHLAPLLAPATRKGVAANTVCACMYEYQRAGSPLPVYLKYFSKYHEQLYIIRIVYQVSVCFFPSLLLIFALLLSFFLSLLHIISRNSDWGHIHSLWLVYFDIPVCWYAGKRGCNHRQGRPLSALGVTCLHFIARSLLFQPIFSSLVDPRWMVRTHVRTYARAYYVHACMNISAQVYRYRYTWSTSQSIVNSNPYIYVYHTYSIPGIAVFLLIINYLRPSLSFFLSLLPGTYH